MNRYVSEQLMTVEEAERLSRSHTDRTDRQERNERRSIWAWQSVDGAMSQTVSEEQVDRAMRQIRTSREK